MSVQWRELVAGAELTNTLASIYESAGATYTAIHAASINNPTNAVVAVGIHIVPAGGIAGPANRIALKNVLAESTGQVPEIVNHKLEPGARIYAVGEGAFITISGATNVPNT